MQILFQLFLGESYHIFSFDLVFIEYLFISLQLDQIQEVDNLFNGPLFDIFTTILQLRQPRQPIILDQKVQIKLLNLWIFVLKLSQILGIEPLLIQRKRRKLLLSTGTNLNLLVDNQFAQLVKLVIHLLMNVIEVLPLAFLLAQLELPNIVRSIGLEQFPTTIRFVILPLALILLILILVTLEPPSLLLACNPFSTVVIAIGVEH